MVHTYYMGVIKDGVPYMWGYNEHGQLGIDFPSMYGYSFDAPFSGKGVITPIKVEGITNAIQLCLGFFNSFILTADGEIFCAGIGTSTVFPVGTPAVQSKHIKISGDHKFVKMFADNGGVIGIKSDGTVWKLGTNGTNIFGDGSLLTAEYRTFTQTTDGIKLKHVFGGEGRYYGIALNGKRYVWGQQNFAKFDFTKTGNMKIEVTLDEVFSKISWIPSGDASNYCFAMSTGRSFFKGGGNYIPPGACNTTMWDLEASGHPPIVSNQFQSNITTALGVNGEVYLNGANVKAFTGASTINEVRPLNQFRATRMYCPAPWENGGFFKRHDGRIMLRGYHPADSSLYSWMGVRFSAREILASNNWFTAELSSELDNALFPEEMESDIKLLAKVGDSYYTLNGETFEEVVLPSTPEQFNAIGFSVDKLNRRVSFKKKPSTEASTGIYTVPVTTSSLNAYKGVCFVRENNTGTVF